MTQDLCTNISLVNATPQERREVLPLSNNQSSQEPIHWSLNGDDNSTSVSSKWPTLSAKTASPVESTVYWSDAKFNEHCNDADFLVQLCSASGLVWIDFVDWEHLSKALLFTKSLSATDASPSQDHPIIPLWSLHLEGLFEQCHLATFPTLAAFTDVTSLSMKGCNTDIIAIMCIFQACPQLTHLKFDGEGLISCSGTEMISCLDLQAGPVPQLKALSMTRPNLFVCDLLHLLGTQPALNVLELKDLSMSVSPKHHIHRPSLHSLTRGILKYLKHSSASIQSLYVPFSLHVDNIDSTRSWKKGLLFEDELVQTCATVPGWKFMADASGYFPFLRRLAQYHNGITTLDLEYVSGLTLWLLRSSDLDKFLCQSAQTLLHLRLPKMHGRPESMDVFHDRNIAMEWIKKPPGDMRPRRPFWACRDLKTLSIGFSGDKKGEIPRSDPYHASHQARLIFGYLARVAPHLEELVMVMNLNNLFLETGFCLLTKMKQLRRLEVRLDFCSRPVVEKLDIDWINAHNVIRDAGIGSQWQTRHWNERRQPWEVLHNTEAKIVAGRERGQNGLGQGNMFVDDLQMEDLDDLQMEDAEDAQEEERWKHVGLFKDVQSVSLDLQREAQEGDHCWPKMESLRILDKHGDAEQAELVIKNLRPEISCQGFKVPAQWDWK
ncbi:hypothetical protein BG000_007744 [Podila horticola]|nr:hypothetical protein BG000_007744 [Podila horticola]